jgi:hypothetical protein
MGVGVGDYDLDGHLDLFKTHFAEDANGLYHNDGKGNFDDVTRSSRVAVDTRYICWGAGMVDLDNDGYPDLFVSTGNVYPEVERKLPQYANKSPRTVYRNLGNRTFEELSQEAGPGVTDAHCSRGCAFGDFDNDGDLDVLIVNMNEPPSLLRNDMKGKRCSASRAFTPVTIPGCILAWVDSTRSTSTSTGRMACMSSTKRFPRTNSSRCGKVQEL